MSFGGGSAPEPDPNIGIAALKASETGEQYLDFMREQAAVTNGWAETDRARYQNTFVPIEDSYIKDALSYDSPERKAQAASQAVADVRQQQAIAQASGERRLSSMGVNPASGRFAGEARRANTAGALAAAGGANTARRQIEAIGDSKRANVVNMGKGLAVNPATSMGISNGAMSSGFQGAMNGYNQQGNLLNTQYQGQLQSWQANQQKQAAIGQAFGSAIGAFMSSEDTKENKRPVQGVLDAVKEMRVEKWRYKNGKGDGGEHIGPYAEEFAEKTGMGNGREISVIDAIGVSMGAIKELAQKVDKLGETEKAEREGGKA